MWQKIQNAERFDDTQKDKSYRKCKYLLELSNGACQFEISSNENKREWDIKSTKCKICDKTLRDKKHIMMQRKKEHEENLEKFKLFEKGNSTYDEKCCFSHNNWKNPFNPISQGGGVSDTPPLAKMINAPKRIAIMIRNDSTFPKYKKQKFWKNFKFKFFTPTPLGGGY